MDIKGSFVGTGCTALVSTNDIETLTKISLPEDLSFTKWSCLYFQLFSMEIFPFYRSLLNWNINDYTFSLFGVIKALSILIVCVVTIKFVGTVYFLGAGPLPAISPPVKA